MISSLWRSNEDEELLALLLGIVRVAEALNLLFLNLLSKSKALEIASMEYENTRIREYVYGKKITRIFL
ncbi:hypothetical protein SUGI_0442040 [Cryptomeria japonica]|nr:hypothetical protein SUGI_0442040 [Cryptomeria japonica]